MDRTGVVVIIPAFNEENAVGKVVSDIPKNLVDEIIVVNNNSTDLTSKAAEAAGATVLFEEQKGYGRACLKGMDYISEQEKLPKIVVFIDADYSDYPEEMGSLLKDIQKDKSDLVIGSRALGEREAGSMTIPQLFGNWLATTLIQVIYKARYTDLGPFRAIRYSTLMAIDMEDKTYGWTVEMQVKVVKNDFRFSEFPVKYRNRIGFSKISGTIKGSILAGYKIITTIFKYL